MNYYNVFYNQKKTDYPYRLSSYLFKRYHLKKGMKLLDIGCGKGEYISIFRKLGLDSYGIDKRINSKYINKHDLDKENIPYQDNTFDVVFSKSFLEHSKNLEHILIEIKRILKDGGILICMVPDWGSQMKSYYDGYDHISPLTERGLRNLMKCVGFNDVETELFYQIPFIWKHSYLRFIPKILSLLPDRLKWKKDDSHRVLIRFSKEKMILASGCK